METIVILKIIHSKPISDLADRASGRVYNIDGIDDVIVVEAEPDLFDVAGDQQ